MNFWDVVNLQHHTHPKRNDIGGGTRCICIFRVSWRHGLMVEFSLTTIHSFNQHTLYLNNRIYILCNDRCVDYICTSHGSCTSFTGYGLRSAKCINNPKSWKRVHEAFFGLLLSDFFLIFKNTNSNAYQPFFLSIVSRELKSVLLMFSDLCDLALSIIEANAHGRT